MKAIVEFYGDPSAGIPGGLIEIDLPIALDSKEWREFTRQQLNKCFAEILDDGGVNVRFGDEDDCC